METEQNAEFDRVNWTPGVPPEEIQRRSTEEFMERVEATHAADTARRSTTLSDPVRRIF